MLLYVQAASRGHGAADGPGRPAHEQAVQHAGRSVRHHPVLPGQALHQQERQQQHHQFPALHVKFFS